MKNQSAYKRWCNAAKRHGGAVSSKTSHYQMAHYQMAPNTQPTDVQTALTSLALVPMMRNIRKKQAV